jgi:eukaryotic-like serine/threonine-protein kinase
MMNNLIGKSMDRYHILEQLGEGGMAVVYKAYDTRLERDVAIKFIQTEKLSKENKGIALKRFKREARLLAKLVHPNIVGIMDFGRFSDSPYLVMPYLSGGTLKNLLGIARPWDYAFKIIVPIARGLEYAHKQRVIHRDVKSSNIIMTDTGTPMLSDFGVAKILSTDETIELTETGVLGIGTPEYMAPEQWTGNTTYQSDQYSLGIVLFELLTGKRPFSAETPAAIILKQATEPLPRLSRLVKNMPDDVEIIINKALARDPRGRFLNIGEFAQALEGMMAYNSLALSDVDPIQKNNQYSDDTTRDELLPEFISGRQFTNSKSKRTPDTRKPRLVVMLLFILFLFLSIYSSRTPSLFNFILGSHKSTLTLSVMKQAGFEKHTMTATATKTLPSTFTPSPIAVLSTSTPAPAIGSIIYSEKDQMALVYVPSGKFTMGSNENLDEQPQHLVDLGSFWIDSTEITNAMYASCVQEGACQIPKGINSTHYDFYYGNPDFVKFPVVNVTWKMAKNYCQWAGRDLPTEAQWEKAARGPDGRKYPWGDGMTCARVFVYSCKKISPFAVGSYPSGVSLYGSYDMAGNVSEWVNSFYLPYPYVPDDGREGENGTGDRVRRGGSGYFFDNDMRSANRGRGVPSTFAPYIGFRCSITP